MPRKILIHATLLFLLGNLWLVPQSRAEGIGMVTGAKTGTYIQFGNDIAKVSKSNGVDILVKESEGSVDNIRRLLSKENAAMGIVQSDLLGFLARSEDPKMRQVSERLRMIFPFYNEEVHLFATKDIKRFEDLNGKRVIVGTKGSGNFLTSNNLLRMFNIKPGEIIELPPAEAAGAVLTGKADAMFYVSGKPVQLFKNIKELQKDGPPEYAKLVENVHFVPLNNEKMLQEYAASEIGPKDYEWVTETVPTVAVRAVLVSFDFSGSNAPYFRERCTDLSKIGKAVRSNLEQLKQTGHPKWKEVDLTKDTGIWKWDACSQPAAGASGPSTDYLQDVVNRIKGNK